MANAVPTLGAIVLDCPDPLALATFYARLLDWPDDPAPAADNSWVSITGDSGRVDFQRVDNYVPPTWPAADRPQMLHLDLQVADLAAAHERAMTLGARLLDDAQETFWVYADPAGHPFCLCAC
ncbi:VOC family protein [Actinokineospora sp.]|uniref:VOC family protein n=1 Tax=Actinokineospora sp. TaxID=1872133 RepID=UPI0040383170